MLGRTDSRRRLIFLLCCFGLLAGALGLRLAYWQIGQGDQLRNLAAQQLTSEAAAGQPERGEIVDTPRQRAGHDRLSRPPCRLPGPAQSRREARGLPRVLAEILGLQGADLDALNQAFNSERAVRDRLAPPDRRRRATRYAPDWPAAISSSSTSSRSRCATTRTAAAIRTPRWPASSWASSPTRARAATASSSTARQLLSGRRRSDGRPVGGTACAGPDRRPDPADHRRQPPAATREGALRGVGRRQGAARDRPGHGSQHRRDPRLGVRARLRRQRLLADRRRSRPTCSWTPSSARSTSPAR